METIQLQKGWLVRQMEEVRRDVEEWPEVLKPLTTINSALTTRPTPIVNQGIRKSDSTPPHLSRQ